MAIWLCALKYGLGITKSTAENIETLSVNWEIVRVSIGPNNLTHLKLSGPKKIFSSPIKGVLWLIYQHVSACLRYGKWEIQLYHARYCFGARLLHFRFSDVPDYLLKSKKSKIENQTRKYMFSIWKNRSQESSRILRDGEHIKHLRVASSEWKLRRCLKSRLSGL